MKCHYAWRKRKCDRMDTLTIFLSALFFTLLGAAYCKGYDITRRHSPGRLPQFYMIMAAIRFVLIVSAVGIYAFLSENRTSTIHFAAMILLMYLVMMMVTLKLKH